MTRFRYVMVTTVATLGIAFAGFVPTAPRLVWNASASVPIGLYTIAPVGRLAAPDLVAVMPPEPFAGFMVARGYVGRDVPILFLMAKSEGRDRIRGLEAGGLRARLGPPARHQLPDLRLDPRSSRFRSLQGNLELACLS